jgi:hypothetical protein
MTDPSETCPFCGADIKLDRGASSLYRCGTVFWYLDAYCADAGDCIRTRLCREAEAANAAKAPRKSHRPLWRRLLAWIRGGGTRSKQ